MCLECFHIICLDVKIIICRLFFGSPHQLTIASIRMIQQVANYEAHVKAITALDCIISDNLYGDDAVADDAKQEEI